MTTYQCNQCQAEFIAADMDSGLTVHARDDLEPGNVTIQVDFECPECGEFTAQFTIGIDAFDEL